MQKERSDVFSISMIELLLIIMFSLLIVMVLLNSTLKKKQDVVDLLNKQIANVKITMQETEKKLSVLSDVDDAPLDLNQAVAQLQAMANNLNRKFTRPEAESVLARMSIDEVWTSLAKLSKDKFSVDNLIKKINELESEILENKGKQLNSYKNFEEIKKENTKLKNQVRYLANNGLVYPPCWSDPVTGAIEYTFKVTIMDEQIYIENHFPDYRNEEFLKITNNKSYDKDMMSPSRFQSEMQFFLKYAKKQIPECRYFSIVVDKTSASSKKEWKRGLRAVESSFYKLEL